MDQLLSEETPFEDYYMEHQFPNIGFKRLCLNARLLKQEETAAQKILLAMEDVTDRAEHRK